MKKSIVETNPAECCFLCGSEGYLERHHIFGGPNRKLSEKYGLTVHLCWMCHQDSREGVHYNREKRRDLQKTGQQAFETRYPSLSFRKIFGINYIEGTDEEGTDHSMERSMEP